MKPSRAARSGHDGSAEYEPGDTHDEGYDPDDDRGEKSSVFEDLLVSSVESPANRNPTRRVDDADGNRVAIAYDEDHTPARIYRRGMTPTSDSRPRR